MCTAEQRDAGLGAAASRVVLQHPAAAAAGATQAASTHLRGPPPVQRSQRSSSRHRRQHRLQRVAASAMVSQHAAHCRVPPNWQRTPSARCSLAPVARRALVSVGAAVQD
jgi:hypothetical protein